MFELYQGHLVNAWKGASDKNKLAVTRKVSYVTNNLICQEVLHKIIGLAQNIHSSIDMSY
jgi:hypothetical protein